MLKLLADLDAVTLLDSRESRQLDRLAIERGSEPSIRLMSLAGRALHAVIRQHWPRASSMTIVCGKGNNAGDGWVLAGLARSRGWKVRVLHAFPLDRMRGDAATARDWAQARDVEFAPMNAQRLDGDILVDALLGTGLRGTVSQPLSRAIKMMDSAPQPVVSVDIPSGLDADTGAVRDSAVCADLTVTFIAVKRGMITGLGPDFCGRIWVADLDIPEAVRAEGPRGLPLLRFGKGDLGLPGKRRRTAHKGDCGRVLVTGGDHGLGGAAILAAESALRAGAGLVTLVTRPEHTTAVLARRPEIMVHGSTDPQVLSELVTTADVLVCGPGLGQSSWGYQLLNMALNSEARLVLDADALNLLADDDDLRSLLKTRSETTILTPHPGEAARLLGCSPADISKDRFAALDRLLEATAAWVVLKGAGSLIGSPDTGCIGVCGQGNPGMATAGMGDVLSGLLGGLWAQYPEPTVALQLGVCAHAAAGDRLAAKVGEHGLLAADVAAHASQVLAGA